MTPTPHLIDRYAIAPELLIYATQGLSIDQQKARPGPGSWSIAELSAHLADCDDVFAVRMKLVLTATDPILTAFDENAWLEKLHSQDVPIAESTALFAATRQTMTRVLRACSEADFARTGRNTEVGIQTLTKILTYAVHHVDHHLKFLYAKRANLGVTLYPRYVNE